MIKHKAILPMIILSLGFALPAYAQQCTPELANDLQRQIDTLRLRTADYTQKLRLKRSELSSLESVKNSQQRVLDRAKSSLQSVQGQYNAAKAEYQAKLSVKLAYEAQTKEMLDKFNNLNTQLETVNAEKSAAENTLKQVEKAHTFTKASLTQLSAEITAANKEDARLANQVDATQKAFDKARFTSNQALITALYKELVALYSKKTASEEWIRNLQLQYAQVNTSMERLNKELVAAQKKLADLVAIENSVKPQIAALQPKIAEIRDQRSKNETALAPAERAFKDSEVEFNYYNRTITSVQTSLNDTLKKIADANAALQTINQSLNTWSGMIRSLTDQIIRCHIILG